MVLRNLISALHYLGTVLSLCLTFFNKMMPRNLLKINSFVAQLLSFKLFNTGCDDEVIDSYLDKCII
ncbi:hypothetical protein GCM10008119_31260 [Pedobacter mendelii]|uniref:Uncharacterized protein n=1 Tax=Pedobacter mendelii TaxID=1908240 RepID=A0ABQ2BKA8_9SPHI|nr:hypothetical protein GCM10008119_31260 [Pedobacter mendelii]